MGVKFTRDSASRISRVVRQIEGQQPSTRTHRNTAQTPQWDYIQCGKTVATSAKGAATQIAIYSGDSWSTLTATGEQIEAWNRFGTIQANRWVFVWTMPWGFEISAAEC
jgi:hypothetical protein